MIEFSSGHLLSTCIYCSLSFGLYFLLSLSVFLFYLSLLPVLLKWIVPVANDPHVQIKVVLYCGMKLMMFSSFPQHPPNIHNYLILSAFWTVSLQKTSAVGAHKDLSCFFVSFFCVTMVWYTIIIVIVFIFTCTTVIHMLVLNLMKKLFSAGRW